MHAARLDKSDRLQRVAALLADGQWHSTIDIVIGAGVCAVNSCVAELRANGMDITCRRVGRERFEYRLELDRSMTSKPVRHDVPAMYADGASIVQIEPTPLAAVGSNAGLGAGG